jgi:hypothetical protein
MGLIRVAMANPICLFEEMITAPFPQGTSPFSHQFVPVRAASLALTLLTPPEIHAMSYYTNDSASGLGTASGTVGAKKAPEGSVGPLFRT